MAVCQNLVPLVNIKIAVKWMFIPLKMVLIGIDPYPNHKMTREPSQGPFSQLAFETGPALPRLAACNRLHASLGLPRLVSTDGSERQLKQNDAHSNTPSFFGTEFFSGGIGQHDAHLNILA